MNLIRQAGLLARAFTARRVGMRAEIPGLQLDRFGRRIGLELLLRRDGVGAEYLLHPVSIVRYFEFDWALSALPSVSGRFLDVASPRLFSFYIARRSPESLIAIINPDPDDAEVTRRLAVALRLRGVHVRNLPVEALADDERFDSIWSLSVVEHIGSEHGDTEAVASLHRRLNPGGALLLTVPVARAFRVEHRDADLYGTRPPQQEGRFFFQRVYDEPTIRERLVGAAPWREVALRWFGETTPGWYAAYERRWRAEGLPFVVDDPRFIAEQFQEYDAWNEMPGDGVCGIVLRK
jgi:SAM-dependent methyltransferase